MKETPYYVFVIGSRLMNQARVQEALTKLWKRLKITHPDRVFTLVRMSGGGAAMEANWWATGNGLPSFTIPHPMVSRNDGTGGQDADYAAGARRVLNWIKVDALVAFREKSREAQTTDLEVQAAIDECAEEFIKTYIVEA